MKHEVIKRFRDLETDVVHDVGSFYESTDNERVHYLESRGFLKSNEKASTVKVEEEKEEKPKRTTRKKESD